MIDSALGFKGFEASARIPWTLENLSHPNLILPVFTTAQSMPGRHTGPAGRESQHLIDTFYGQGQRNAALKRVLLQGENCKALGSIRTCQSK